MAGIGLPSTLPHVQVWNTLAVTSDSGTVNRRMKIVHAPRVGLHCDPCRQAQTGPSRARSDASRLGGSSNQRTDWPTTQRLVKSPLKMSLPVLVLRQLDGRT